MIISLRVLFFCMHNFVIILLPVAYHALCNDFEGKGYYLFI